MAKSEYIGINNVARKVKGIYIGVNGVARKVTKGYIGVGGVARQFYPGVVYNTWKKYNIIGATFSKVQISQYKVLSISVDNTVQDPIPFICTSASPASLNIKEDSYTVSSASLKKGSITSSVVGYRRWSDKEYHNDKLIRLHPRSQLEGCDLFPRDSRRDVFHYIFPGFVPVDDCLYYYHQYSGSIMWEGIRFVPNIDSITLARYKYSEDNDGDEDHDIYYYALSSASAVSTIVAPQGTYPDCGVHSDGCIYIKQ